MFSKCLYNYSIPRQCFIVDRFYPYYALIALFIRPQIPTLINSSHADLKSCTPNLSITPPNTDILKNILTLTHARYLFDDVDAVVELLSLQHRMQVREEDVEMMAPVSVRYDHGDAMPRDAVSRPADAARQQSRVLTDDLRLGVVVLVRRHVDEYTTSCMDCIAPSSFVIHRAPAGRIVYTRVSHGMRFRNMQSPPIPAEIFPPFSQSLLVSTSIRTGLLCSTVFHF